MNSWARSLRLYAAASLLLLMLICAGFLALDPYDSGRLALLGGYGVPASLGPSLTAASTARAPDAEAAIIGSSTVELLDPARLSEAAAMHVVSLALRGSGPVEQLAVARWYVATHSPPSQRPPKALIFGIDNRWCVADGMVSAIIPFPFWLYSRSIVEYAIGLMRLKTFEAAERKIKLMLGHDPALPADGHRDFETGRLWNRAAAERAFAGSYTRLRAKDPPDFAAVPLLREFFTELPTSTRVILLFPPRHASDLPPAGSAQARIESQCKAAYGALAASHKRTLVVDLTTNDDVSRDDNNFWDQVHYRGPIARWIENELAKVLLASAAGD